MNKLALIALTVLAGTTAVSAEGYNPRYTLSTSQLVGTVEQRPAAEVVVADDFVNSDQVSVTVVERSIDAPVNNPR